MEGAWIGSASAGDGAPGTVSGDCASGAGQSGMEGARQGAQEGEPRSDLVPTSSSLLAATQDTTHTHPHPPTHATPPPPHTPHPPPHHTPPHRSPAHLFPPHLSPRHPPHTPPRSFSPYLGTGRAGGRVSQGMGTQPASAVFHPGQLKNPSFRNLVFYIVIT